MQLSKPDSDFFFSVYYPLLYYSYSYFDEIDMEEFIETSLNAHIIARNHIYKNRKLIDEYIEAIRKENKTEITGKRLSLLNSIKEARYTDFIVVEKNKNVYYIDYRKGNSIYKIVGLSQDIFELHVNYPCLVQTALIQFDKNCIVSDGLIEVKKSKYPSNASKLIMRDFEKDINQMLKKEL